MDYGKTILFLTLFLLMILQMFLSVIQVKRYQKAVKSMLGGVVLGIGHRKGKLKGGEILILAYNRESDLTAGCKSMRGMTIFASFEDKPEYVGLSLAEAREIGVRLDEKDMGRYRKRHPYNPGVLSKKKGAFIQAVEAIELRLSNEKKDAGVNSGTELAESL